MKLVFMRKWRIKYEHVDLLQIQIILYSFWYSLPKPQHINRCYLNKYYFDIFDLKYVLLRLPYPNLCWSSLPLSLKCFVPSEFFSQNNDKISSFRTFLSISWRIFTCIFSILTHEIEEKLKYQIYDIEMTSF